MSKYLVSCPECDYEFIIELSKQQTKDWDNKTLQKVCESCNQIILPKSICSGSPIHHIRNIPIKPGKHYD